jgi:two-component system response regulator YesN
MIYEKTIVIAEDEPKTRNGITKTLEQWSKSAVRIVAFENGMDALEYIKANPVNLIITDIRMPGITGLRLIESVRDNQSNVSAIIISGFAEFEYAREALDLQVCAYLLKPLNKDKLIMAVEQALQVGEKRNRVQLLEKIVDPALVQVDRYRSSIADSIQEVLQFVENQYDRPIGLREAAAYIHMNASYVSALFKEQVGLTFSEYLTRYRIQKAKEFLIATQLNVNEISEKVGYVTTKYFVKVFKEQEKVSPSEYRKQWNKDV